MLDYVRKYALIGLAIVGIGLFMFGGVMGKEEETLQSYASTTEDTLDMLESPVMEEEDETPDILLVDIKGAVKHPGLYKINDGDRIQDVIEQAGGLAKDADEDQVNLAQRVQDEMVIYIPVIGEELEELDFQLTSNNNGDTSDGKVAINRATVEEIQTLNGIGPKKAETIISHREEHGPFQTVEDLLQVSGIGEKTLENIRDQIIVP